jgi:hypothetical protein
MPVAHASGSRVMGRDDRRGVAVSQRTQVERVIAAARSYRGVTQVDFLGPSVVDGKEPITRLAARLWDAEREGYSFECLGRRDKCKVWRLCGEPDVERTASNPPDQPANAPHGAPATDVWSHVGSKSGVVSGDAGLISRASASGSLDAGRLFEVEPERTHHYEEAA